MAVIYGDDLANDLSGTAGADSIYGLGGGDTLTGDVGDVLFGGAGDDVYYVTKKSNVVNPVVSEGFDSGSDTVYVRGIGDVNYALPSNVEYAYAVGGVYLLKGNALDNELHCDSSSIYEASILGDAGDDILYGTNRLDLGDILNGGSGDDGMIGGKGDDWYSVDSRGDIIIEYAGEGVDTVELSANRYKLNNYVENMEIYGGDALFAYGNWMSNKIVSHYDFSRIINAGAGSDSVLVDGVADDILIGGAGNDTLQAGLGNDVYRTSGAFGHDEITDTGGDDAVEFDVNEGTLWFSKSGSDLSVSVIGTQNGVTIKNWYSDATAKIEEFYAGTGKMLTAAKVDTLVDAMSAFAQPTTAALPANIQTALAPTLAAAWQ